MASRLPPSTVRTAIRDSIFSAALGGILPQVLFQGGVISLLVLRLGGGDVQIGIISTMSNACMVMGLFLAYWLLPHRKIKIRHSLISAVIAGAMFEVIKMGFAFYAKYLGFTLSYVYGTMAILPLFMIWIYMAWLIFLFGAELNAALHEVQRHDLFDQRQG